MKQEEKELLLKDLCARLPYGVKCQVQEDEFTYIGTLCRLEVDSKNGNLLDFTESMSGLDCQVYLSEVKPYLFPLSSMTDEQCKELRNLYWHFDNVEINNIDDLDMCNNYVNHSDCYILIDWFHKNHFDYRGLIKEGLAIDATDLNIY